MSDLAEVVCHECKDILEVTGKPEVPFTCGGCCQGSQEKKFITGTTILATKDEKTNTLLYGLVQSLELACGEAEAYRKLWMELAFKKSRYQRFCEWLYRLGF